MASNSTSLSTAGGYANGFTLSISWSENSTSVTNNTSNITATATLSKQNAIFWVTNAGALRCYWHDNKSNSDTEVASLTVEEIGYENNSRSASATFNVTHKDDGTLKGYAWAKWEAWSSYGGYPPVSGSVATSEQSLTTIARASAPTMSASSITIPASSGTITVNTNRASSSFTHTITLKVGNTTIATYTGVGASKAINIADIDDAILATIPSATTATVSVSCQTFSGSTSVGTKSTSFTANVGSGAKPTFSNFTFADVNSTTTTVTGNSAVMISGKSTLRATISAANKATAKYSATMVKYTFSCAGLSAEQAYSTSQITKDLGSPTVANTELPSGTRDLVITAIDSRGLSTSVTKTVTIVPYQAPIINATATRANGFEDTTTVHIAGTFSRIEVSGAAKNTVNTSSGVAYRYKPQSSTSWTIDWTNKTATVNTTNGTVSVSNFTHELDNQTAYDFQFRIIDKLQTTTASLVVAIGQPAFYIGSDGRVCVGGMPTVAKPSSNNGQLEVSGRVVNAKGGTWIKGRDNVAAYNAKTGSTSSFDPVCGVKTQNGAWCIGSLKSDANDQLYLSYTTDSNYSSNTNQSQNYTIKPDGTTTLKMSLDKIYPVGSIYMSATLDTAAKVQNALGGTWAAWGAGRVPVGVDTSDDNFNTVGKTGGSNTHTHGARGSLRADIWLNWQNNYNELVMKKSDNGAFTGTRYTNTTGSSYVDGSRSVPNSVMVEGTTGSGSSLQKYITVYMYKRTA